MLKIMSLKNIIIVDSSPHTKKQQQIYTKCELTNLIISIFLKNGVTMLMAQRSC